MTRQQPYHEYQAQNPFRPPDWRWRRARDLVDNGRYYSKKRDDTETGIVVRYMRARRRYEDRLFRLKELFPELHAAYGIYEAGKLVEWEIQCRFLARQTPSEIADVMLLRTDAIDMYKSIFFDISDRLEARAYVIHSVIGLPPVGPPPPSTLMKAHAYLMGPAVIDAWVDYMQHHGEQHDLATREGRRRAWIKLDLAVRSLSGDEQAARRLIKTADLIFKLPSNFPKTRTVSGTLAKMTSEVIDKLPWGSSTKTSPRQPGIDGAARRGMQTDLKRQITEAA